MNKNRKQNYRSLLIGQKDTKKILGLNPKRLFCHTSIIGQSGSGKSFMLGRLIEEIVLQTNGKIVIFDLNSDFIRIKEVNKAAWSNKDLFFVQNYDLDSNYNEFNDAWNKEINETSNTICMFHVRPKTKANLFISWEELSEKELRQLFGFNATEHPEAISLLKELKQQERVSNWTFEHWKTLSSLIVKWARKNFKITENGIDFDPNLARYIATTVSVQSAQLTATAIKDSMDYDIWHTNDSPNFLDQILPIKNISPNFSTLNLPRVTCINLDLLRDNTIRLFIVRHILERLWMIAAESRRQILHKEINDETSKDERVPIFIVVDEAHRLAPQITEVLSEAEVLGLFRQFAAEGRKYGLYLILATQRPSKLHQDILSECDNVCVMRLVSNKDIERIKDTFSFIEKSKLKGINTFKTGQAIFSGPWVDDSTVKAEKIAAQRTKTGGGNLPKENFVKFR